MAKAHWASQLIGKPYERLGRGPAAFDCWGLPKFCWREQLGLDVPDVGADATDLAKRVRAFKSFGFGAIKAHVVDKPAEFDAVYMTTRKLPIHVGLWIAPDAQGGVLHAIEGAGVVFQRRASLLAHGITILQFVRIERA